jgi:ubiquilin
MGPPPSQADILQQLDDPNFAQQMNEAMNNPAVIQMLENHPMVRDNPLMRQMIRDPAMRRMMMNPQMIRAQMEMQRHMDGGNGGASAFPAPGMTDTTPGAANTGTNPAQAASNPLAGLLGGAGAGGAAAGANPFASLFGPGGGFGTTPTTSPPPAASAGGGTPSGTTDRNQPNPFDNIMGLFNQPQAGAGADTNPLAQMTAQMMQNPEMMRSAMNMLNAGGMPGAMPGATGGADAGASPANPFASLFGPGGGAGMFQPPATQTPPDNRPPEERYESQLRQLNDMGFFDFDTNVTALRRSGGSVHGAIEFLLGGGG